MKFFAFIFASFLLCFSVCLAGESSVPAATETTSTSNSSRIKFPTGVFFNEYDFVKVESTWVRICIDRQSKEYDITHAEKDPFGNYALVLDGSISITIYPNGNTLYYNGVTYTKKKI